MLLNSWTPVQQIVYHMLRYFVKTKGFTDITDNSGHKILSNYNIKTLMLWACESKGSSWWTDELNVVGICVELLHVLADWITAARCPQYFVNDCNLFDTLDNSDSTQITACRLTSVTEKCLARWFVNNYIRTPKCIGHCPNTVSRLFDDISSELDAKLLNAVSAVADWRLNVTFVLDCSNFLVAQHLIHELLRPVDPDDCPRQLIPALYRRTPTARLCLYLMREWSTIDDRLSVYFTAVVFLHVAFNTNKNRLRDEMMDILSTVCLQSTNVRRCLRERHSSVLSLSQAGKLMKVVTNNSRSTVQLIEIELSKAYLYRALRLRDVSGSDSIYCLTNVYLAVLYYTTGQYQTAIDHCTLVTRAQENSQCSSHVVEGKLLPKIDDEIDIVLGLAVFYQYLQTAALNQRQQTQHVSVFSTQLFAHYLQIRCQSVMKCSQFTQMSSTDHIKLHYCLRESSQMFVTDVMIFIISLRRPEYPVNGATPPVSSKEQTKPVTSHHLDTSELVELLQKSTVEHLTKFREIKARDFGSVATTATTDFEALYAYRRGDYQLCLQLSTQNLHTLIGSRVVTYVLMESEFIQLMDNDLACINGLALLVDLSYNRQSTNVPISQLTLSLYLMTRCQTSPGDVTGSDTQLHCNRTSTCRLSHYS